jgi:hypothetical protein
MRRVFLSDELQKEFDSKGYVIVDLFSREKSQQLLNLFDELEGAKGTANTNANTYELSFFEKNEDRKRAKFNSVYSLVKPEIDNVLNAYNPIIINLFNKEKGKGEVPIHQNWTFVDEDQYTSVSIWCPLQDVSRSNGTLEVVPGTHKVVCNYRGPSIPWVFDNLNSVIKEKYMVPLNLKMGQVGIIDDSVIHYSGQNESSSERKAIQLIMKPSEAPTVHCYKRADSLDEIEIMEVPDDYFFDFDMWQEPKPGINLRLVQEALGKISETELQERINSNLHT